MREKILTYIERNSRVDLKDLAIMLGTDEAAVANEIADMEKEGECVSGMPQPFRSRYLCRQIPMWSLLSVSMGFPDS